MVVNLAVCSPSFTVPVVLFLLSFRWSQVQSACLSSCPSSLCNSLHNPSEGYCASDYYVQTSSQQSYQANVQTTDVYYTSCGAFGWNRCSRSRTRYRGVTQYRTTYASTMQCSTYCCSGYSGVAPNCQLLPAQIVQTSTTTSSLYLQWTRSAGDSIILYYWKNSTPSDVSTINTTSLLYNITGLDSNTAYKVIVSARNSVGSANSSEVVGYTPPEAGGLVTPTPLSSTSINVQWSPPPNSDRLALTYHVNYTGMSRSTSDTTLTLTGLHPYEEYTISVQAGNEGGLSVPVTGTARTYSDRPSVGPDKRFSNPGRHWCNLQWMIPETSGRNGVIQKYIIELEQTDDNKWNITHELPNYNFSSPASISYNLTNLTPHTTYKWRVAAATVNGTGPFTPNPKEFTTLEDVPGPVSYLKYITSCKCNASVVVSWGEPDNPNGVIKGYIIRYGEEEGSFTTNRTVDASITELEFAEDLNPYTPYKATVVARTSAGEGEPSSVVFFTMEGVPTAQPDDVDVVALGDGSVRVGWKPLSLTESRGFPLYIVSYTSDDGTVLGSVNTTNSSVIITGLNPDIGYSFAVQVATEIGNGPAKINYLKSTLPSPSCDTNAVTYTVVAFIGGAIFGAISVVLVAGIVFGVFKLRRKCSNKNTKQERPQEERYAFVQTNPALHYEMSGKTDPQEATYEVVETTHTVHHDTNFIMMEKNVAYDHQVDLKA